MSRRTATQPGFTLVELLVVIGIIALLLGILAPSLARAKMKAQQIVCMNNLRQINLAFELYANNHNDTYPCNIEDKDMPWLWMGRGWRPYIEPYMGVIIDANSPSVLLCPVDKKSVEMYDSTSYAYSMAFYHSPAQIDSLTSHKDTYSNPQDSIGQKITSVARPSEKIMAGEWLSVHQQIDIDDNGWWCPKGRRNFLFADGSSAFIRAENINPANDGNPNPCLTINGIKGSDHTR